MRIVGDREYPQIKPRQCERPLWGRFGELSRNPKRAGFAADLGPTYGRDQVPDKVSYITN